MMQDPITYFLSAEVTLSDKAAGSAVFCHRLICIYTAAAISEIKAIKSVMALLSSGLTLG